MAFGSRSWPEWVSGLSMRIRSPASQIVACKPALLEGSCHLFLSGSDVSDYGDDLIRQACDLRHSGWLDKRVPDYCKQRFGITIAGYVVRDMVGLLGLYSRCRSVERIIYWRPGSECATKAIISPVMLLLIPVRDFARLTRAGGRGRLFSQSQAQTSDACRNSIYTFPSFRSKNFSYSVSKPKQLWQQLHCPFHTARQIYAYPLFQVIVANHNKLCYRCVQPHRRLMKLFSWWQQPRA